MKIFSRFISVVMAIAMLLSFAITSAFAAGELTMTATPSVNTVNEGEAATIDVTVSLENNPGLAYVAFTVAYPEGFTLTAKDASVNVVTGFDTKGYSKDLTFNPYSITYETSDTMNTTGDGALIKLTFEVADTVDAGDYTISLGMQESKSVYDEDFSYYTPEFVDAKITVKGDEPELPEASITKAGNTLIEETKDASNRVTVAALGTILSTNDTKPISKATVTVKAENGTKAQSYDHTFAIPATVLSGTIKVAINVRNVPYAEKDNVTFEIAVAE